MNSIRPAHPRTGSPLNGSRLHRAQWLFGALILSIAMPACADIFNVNSSGDAGQDPATTNKCAAQGDTAHCTLRAAITYGNAHAGAHTINIGVPLITVVNGGLTQLRAPFTVNGNHATINGNNHGCFDLTDSGTVNVGHSDGATGSQLLNLVIGNCSGAGISANGHNYVFTGNYIGVNTTGLVAMPNVGDGISVSASHVYPDTSTNHLLNLYNSFPIQPIDASQINAFSSNLATALASLEPVLISNNVISGNGGNGITIFSQNIAAVTVSGNMIGTDFTGNAAIPNVGNGVYMVGSSFGNLIGPDNVISGNSANGIRIDAGSVFLPNFIMGNRIGLSATLPNVHIGNALSGIVTNTRPDTSVASANPSGTSLVIGPANVIADNKGANNNGFPDTLGGDSAGILITGVSNSVKVLGNTIGLAEFPVGTALNSAAFGNKGDGIIVTIGGNSIGGGNIIAANARHGIVVSGSGTASTRITGNSIGVSPAFAGNLTLGNGVDGIHIDAASATTIGGPNGTDANTIAANKRNGIKLRNGGGDQHGWSNLFQRNLAFHNAVTTTGIDIDLERPENGVDGPHSEFPPNYANRDQAPAQICPGIGSSGACIGSNAPSSSGGFTTLQWSLDTHGPANFRLEFFAINASTTTAASTMTFLGEQLVTTDVTGKPSNSAVCSAGRCTAKVSGVTIGNRVVMTVTDITPLTNTPAGGGGWQAQLKCFIGNNGIILPTCTTNDTSEYSNAVAVQVSDIIFKSGFE
ncbi:MAG: hypothetical protein ABI082_02585 [Dokdonella sp.]